MTNHTWTLEADDSHACTACGAFWDIEASEGPRPVGPCSQALVERPVAPLVNRNNARCADCGEHDMRRGLAFYVAPRRTNGKPACFCKRCAARYTSLRPYSTTACAHCLDFYASDGEDVHPGLAWTSTAHGREELLCGECADDEAQRVEEAKRRRRN